MTNNEDIVPRLEVIAKELAIKLTTVFNAADCMFILAYAFWAIVQIQAKNKEHAREGIKILNNYFENKLGEFDEIKAKMNELIDHIESAKVN